MKILLVSFYFAPSNVIGAVRVSKLAKYLAEQGHDVKVICGDDTAYAHTLPLEIDEANVIRTDWFDVNGFVRSAINALRGKGWKKAQGQQLNSAGKRSFWVKLYSSIVSIPDAHWGWISPAKKAGRELFKTWKPDVIVASGGPFSGFVIASSLAKKAGCTWFADYRDLWSENHDYLHLPFRRSLDRWIETKALSSAGAIFTVSPLLADKLGNMHDKPVQVMMNGFDPDDVPSDIMRVDNKDILTICYMGKIYPGLQTPEHLFKACASLPKEMHDKIRISFYGRSHDLAKEMADRCGVSHMCVFPGEVSFNESVALQARSDVLLFLLFSGEQAGGVFTGKLFEYIGVRRPVIATGDIITGDVCDFITERKIGVVENDVEKLRDILVGYIEEKQKKGMIKAVPKSAGKGLSRSEQYKLIEDACKAAA